MKHTFYQLPILFKSSPPSQPLQISTTVSPAKFNPKKKKKIPPFLHSPLSTCPNKVWDQGMQHLTNTIRQQEAQEIINNKKNHPITTSYSPRTWRKFTPLMASTRLALHFPCLLSRFRYHRRQMIRPSLTLHHRRWIRRCLWQLVCLLRRKEEVLGRRLEMPGSLVLVLAGIFLARVLARMRLRDATGLPKTVVSFINFSKKKVINLY